jgi:hypothetical protein
MRKVFMSTEKITEIVKEKYGQAALRVTTGDGDADPRPRAHQAAAIPSPAICTMPGRPVKFLRKR